MGNKKKKSFFKNKTVVAYSFILPNLIGFCIFTLIPVRDRVKFCVNSKN